MDKIIKSLVIFSALLWLVACPGPSTNTTHMGVPPGEHVVLEGIGGGNEICKFDFRRTLPDGTIASGLFRVPEGKMLVITDVDWQYHYEELANKMMILRLMIYNLADVAEHPGPHPHPNMWRVFESTVILNQFGEGGISESMTSGFVMSSGAWICPDIFPGPEGPPYGLQHLILRGYLVPE